MTQIDLLKEKISYLKLWLGIIVVTDISLVGWLIGNYTVSTRTLIVGDVVAILVVSFGIYVLHKRIENEIERLKEL
jgi:multisubunit Na+/H+ antiporter MnhE subunit